MTFTESKDRRIQRTQTALRDAFVELVLSRSYDDIKVSDIIAKANVGRSTFYEHYSGKEDILGSSLLAPMSIMASALDREKTAEDVQPILEHFWQNRSFARLILTGTPKRQVINTLSKLLEDKLVTQCRSAQVRPLIPLSMNALMLAEAQMALVTAWLSGKAHCTVSALATIIESNSKAILKSIIDEARKH